MSVTYYPTAKIINYSLASISFSADLIGFPLRVVVGPKTLKAGEIEVKVRRTGEVTMLPVEGDHVAALKEMLAKL